MENLLQFWRKNTILRILLVGCIVLAQYLIIEDIWSGAAESSWKVRLFIALVFFVALVIGLIFLFLGLFSGFVLPVRGLKERFQAWVRLILFMFGSHGQALWVKNGELDDNSRNANNWRHPATLKPGVLILDAASGAQLRTSSQLTRTVGPGLTFIPKREYLAGMVTLGRQVSFPPVRPLPDEDPFAPQGKKETDTEYQARVNRRKGVSGYTRDGVEVLATMLVGFKLDDGLPIRATDIGPKDDLKSNSAFKYNPVAVRRAVNAEAVNSKIKDPLEQGRHISWNNLPGYFVVNLWREYLRKFTLNELFSNLPEGHDFAGMTALEVIRERVKARLTQSHDVLLDAYGNIVRRHEPSREYHLLRSWGIKVLFSPIRNPQLPPDVEQTQVEKWFSFWKWRAEDERKFIDRKRKYMQRKGHIQALSTYVDNILKEVLPNLPDDLSEKENSVQMMIVLSSLLDATRKLCISDTELQRVLENEEQEIVEIIGWLNWLNSELV
ncbi:MAG: hypothetical protein DRI56_02640 [Chloroflexota bacterium]|nr:MAG: hypothetical protein DRI56_02640 [Chloroflexota bacterium]